MNKINPIFIDRSLALFLIFTTFRPFIKYIFLGLSSSERQDLVDHEECFRLISPAKLGFALCIKSIDKHNFQKILPSMSYTSNRMVPCKIKDYYHLCFQTLQKLPLSLRDSAISATSENTRDINPKFYSAPQASDYLY